MPDYFGLCAGKNGLTDALCRAPDLESARAILADYAGSPCVHVAPASLPVWWVTYQGRLVEVAAVDAVEAERVVTAALQQIASPYKVTLVERRPPELDDETAAL